MKKRILALILALCVSSVNVTGAFATAPEGTTAEETAAVEEPAAEEEEEVSPAEEAGPLNSEEMAKEEQQDDSDDAEDSLGDVQNDSAQEEDASQGSDVSQSDSEEQGEDTASEEESEEQNSDSADTSEEIAEEDSAQGASSENEISEDGSTIIAEEQEMTDSNTAKEGVIASGTCGKNGDNLTWELSGTDSEMTLTISGTGEMINYVDREYGPWYKYSSKIVSVVIGHGVTNIGDFAFYMCSGLTSITVPEGVTNIGFAAFAGCSSFTSVVLPEGVVSIGGYAFSGCSSLSSITLQKGLRSIGENAFNYCENLTTLTFPEGVTNIGKEAFRQCYKLGNVELQEGLTSIGEYAFYCCYGLWGVRIPNSVTSIGDGAFYFCSNLRVCNLPEGVTNLEDSMFESCGNLTFIELPKGLTSIGNNAFRYCGSLTRVMLPEGLTSIGNRAFERTEADVYVPMSVTKISNTAFNEFEGRIVYEGTMDEWDSIYNGPKVYFDNRRIGFETDELILAVGQTKALEIACNFDNNKDEIKWKSSDKDIAGIDNDGVVTAKQPGEAVITASISAFQCQQCQIKIVVIQQVSGINLNKSDISVFHGDTFDLVATIEPENASNKNIIWESSDPEIVAVDDTGHVEALSTGTATITATSESEGYKASCVISVSHDWETEYTIDQEPTCTEKGSKSIHCRICNEKTDIQEIAELGHDWENEYTIDQKSSCTEKGSKSIHCSRCDEQKDIREIDFEHDWEEEYTIDLEPTCTEKGSKSIHCKRCDEKTDIQEIIELGHDWEEEYTIDLEPTCTEKGSKSIHCRRCNEKKDIQEIAPEHDWEEEYTIDIEPTCTEKGSKSIHCRRCDEKKDIQEIAPEHDWEEEYTIDLEPTCTEKGSKSIHCKRCEEKHNIEEIPALGHSFTNYVLDPQKGVKVAECDHDCGEKDTVEVAQTTSGTCGNGLTWKLYDYDGGTLYISGTGAMEEYDAGKPSPWSALEFTACVVGNGVTSIGGAAFENCKTMERIDLADSVTSIGSYAFYNCAKMKDCKMSDGIQTIGASAFEKCGSLENLAFNEKNAVTFGKNALKSCGSLSITGFSGTLAETTAEEYGYPFVSIGAIGSCGTSANYVFKKADGLLVISGSGSVSNYIVDTKTGKSSASWSDFEIRNVNIGSNITRIGDGAFAGCSQIEKLVFPSKVTTIGEYVCMGCSSLKQVTIQGGITAIPLCAFKECGSLSSVFMNDSSITTIQAEAFKDCTSLERFGIPNKVTRIEENAFSGSGLTRIYLPSGLKFIGEKAFADTELGEASIPASVSTLSETAFINCQNLAAINVDSGNSKYASTNGILTNKDGTVILFCPAGKEGTVTLPHRVAEINENAFAGCSKITELNLSEGLETIGEGAFSRMTINQIYIPSSTTSIGAGAFYRCQNLETIDVAADSEYFDTVDGILYDAAHTRLIACPAMTEGMIEVPETVRKIEDYAFAGNKGISEVTVPNWVNEIGENAFAECELTMKGYDNSYAKEYAESKGIPFTALEGSYCVKEMAVGESIDAHELIGKGLSAEEISGWRSSDSDIAAVDEDGVVTALSDGEVRINVDAEGRTESCILIIYKHWGYNIEFNANGGSGTMEPMRGLSLDETYELSPREISYLAHTFEGWEYVDENGNKVVLEDCAQVKSIAGHGETVTLSAKWKYKKNTIELTGTPNTGIKIALEGDDLYLYAEKYTKICGYYFKLDDTVLADVDYPTLSSAKDSVYLGTLKEGIYSIIWGTAAYSEAAEFSGTHSYIIVVSKDESPEREKVSLADTEIEIADYVNSRTGAAITPISAIRYGGVRLLEGRDYTVEYKNNVNAGQAQATIIGKGRFTGTITKNFWIVEKEGDKVSLLNDATEVTGLDTCIYNGKPHVLTNIKVRIGNILLEEGKDYTLEFKDNVNIGKGKVLITGTGIYKDTINAEFTIRADSVAYADISGVVDKVYTGEEITQDITVKFGETKLTEGKDYTVSYKNNVNAGTATMVITGKGSYAGTAEKTFTIGKAERSIEPVLSEEVIVAGRSAKVTVDGILDGIVCASQDTSIVTVSGTTVTGAKAGTAKITVTAEEDANYKEASAELEVRVVPGKTTRGDMFNLANNVKVTWKEVPGAKYYKVYREGVTNPAESLTEPVIVTTGLIGWDKQPGLTNGNAYRYKIVASLTGKGDPSGDSPLSYYKLMYRLKTVVIRSVKNTAPGKVTVKYDKTVSGDSYVLQYCERQDMVGAKTKVVLGANNTSYVIGGLKKGKTYYISIRVRKKVNGIDYYTTFGVPKKVTILK